MRQIQAVMNQKLSIAAIHLTVTTQILIVITATTVNHKAAMRIAMLMSLLLKFQMNSWAHCMIKQQFMLCATYCAIMEFASTARLPYSSIEKLLQLLQLLCPPDSRLPTSMYRLKRFFQMFSPVYQETEFCSGCGHQLPGDHSCPPGQKSNVIVSLPLQRAIQSLLLSTFVSCTT